MFQCFLLTTCILHNVGPKIVINYATSTGTGNFQNQANQKSTRDKALNLTLIQTDQLNSYQK